MIMISLMRRIILNNKFSDDNFPFGKPTQEIDEPLDTSPCGNNIDYSVETTSLTPQEIVKERDKERNERRYYKAFNLIIICLALIIFIYVFDNIVYVITNKTNQNFSSIIEVLKALLYSLTGYLFASKTMKTND